MSISNSVPSDDGGLRSAATGSRWPAPLLAACAALLGALLYANALGNPFVYDDYALVVENPTLQDLTDIRGLLLRNVTRPLVNLSYALDKALWGGGPFGYHLTNVILHVLNILLVFEVTRRACEDRQRQAGQVVRAPLSPPIAALAASILFACHPALTEAVSYVASRAEVASAGFFLASFLAGRRWMISGGPAWWAACVAAWLAASLTKETAIMLPFVLAAYSWTVLDAPPAEQRRRFLHMGLPLMGIATAGAVARVAVMQFVEYSRLPVNWRFTLVSADAVWLYLSLLAYPHDQAISRAMTMPDPAHAMRMAAGILGLLAAVPIVWMLRRTYSLMSFGSLWFLMLLVPPSALFALGVGEPIAERRCYLASVGLFLWWGSAFAMLWERSSGRMPLRVPLAFVAVLFTVQLSLRTLLRNEIWGDPILLMRESVTLAPDHWIPWMLLGDAYRREERCEDAILAYRRVLEIRPKEETAYNKISGCLINRRRFDEAREVLLQLRGINPASEEAAMSLGVLALLRGDAADARVEFAQAADRHPESVEARKMLAFVDGMMPAKERQEVCDYLRSLLHGAPVSACPARG